VDGSDKFNFAWFYVVPQLDCRAIPGMGGRPADSRRGDAGIELRLCGGRGSRCGSRAKCLVLPERHGPMLLPRKAAVAPRMLLLPFREKQPYFRLPVCQKPFGSHSGTRAEQYPDRNGQDAGFCPCFASNSCGRDDRYWFHGYSFSLFAGPDLPGSPKPALSTRRLILRLGGIVRAYG